MAAHANETGAIVGRAPIARSAPPRAPHVALVVRLARNSGWILGGRAAAGIMSIAYIAIAARVLGPHRFGVFSLILAYAGGLAGFVAFQTHNAVVRYGSRHLAAGRRDAFAALLGSLALLDAAAALAGIAIAAAGAGIAAHGLGWTDAERHAAILFSAAVMLSAGTTGSGILRLLGRFGRLTGAEAIGPAIRLVGAMLLWFRGGGLADFLTVWGIALVGETLAGWLAALTDERVTIAVSPRAVRSVLREERGIVAFLLHNSVTSSLSLVWQFGGTLIVGAYASTSAAGAYRLATKLNGAIGKLAEAIMRALYPELAHLVAADDRPTLAALFVRVLLAAVALSTGFVLLVAVFGGDALALLYGRAYLYAAPLLLLLAIATGIDIAGSATKPFLNAHGASGKILAAYLVAAAVFGTASLLLVPRLGAVGAGIAAIAGMLTLRTMTGVATLRLLRARAGS